VESHKLQMAWSRIAEPKRSTKNYIIELLLDLETLGHLDCAGPQLAMSVHIGLPSCSCEAAADLIHKEIPPVRGRIEFQLREMFDTLEQKLGSRSASG
jgi:hypothetical protein